MIPSEFAVEVTEECICTCIDPAYEPEEAPKHASMSGACFPPSDPNCEICKGLGRFKMEGIRDRRLCPHCGEDLPPEYYE